jgi:hypothetical protein
MRQDLFGKVLLKRSFPTKNNNMEYHPELAVQYFSDKYKTNYRGFGTKFDLAHLAQIYGLDVDVDTYSCTATNGGKFRGNPISKEEANKVLHSNLFGGIFYGIRSGKFRKLGGWSRQTRHFTKEAFDYIVNELHCELLRAKLPLAPTAMLPDGCHADFIRELPKLPLPAELVECAWPENWHLDIRSTKQGKVDYVRCAPLGADETFYYAHKRPHKTELSTLRWWTLARGASFAIRFPKTKPGLAGELIKHAEAIGLPKETLDAIIVKSL